MESGIRRHPETGRPETDEERVDRNLLELLNELRVALPGVQVLFAFLLVVPFSSRYGEVSDFQERVYFFTLLCTGAASVLLIAPSIHHRLEFRHQDKEHIVLVANRLAIGGLSFLAVAMVSMMLLITDFIFSREAAIVVTTLAALALILVWYAIPFQRVRERKRRESARQPVG
jgi:Family of unknown function (DUF6328)